MKKIKYIVILFTLFLLAGCLGETRHTEDLNKKYKSYWDYSLGDYVYIDKWKSDNGGGSGGFTSNTYKKYTFTYTDKNGIEKSFNIDNYQTSFESIYEDILADKFDTIIKNRFIKNTKYELKDLYPLKVTKVVVKKIDKNIEYYDSIKGVKIRELDADNYYLNNLSILLDIDLDVLEHYDDYEVLKQNLIDDFSYIFRDYGYKNLTLMFYLREKVDSFNSACYTLDYDGIMYNWDTCYNEEGNYKWLDK